MDIRIDSLYYKIITKANESGEHHHDVKECDEYGMLLGELEMLILNCNSMQYG